MTSFGICICDEDDDGIYDFPSEPGSLRGPLAGSLMHSEHNGNTILSSVKEVSTYKLYESEDGESRHAGRLDAMRMATDEAAARAIKNKMDKQRAIVRTNSASLSSCPSSSTVPVRRQSFDPVLGRTFLPPNSARRSQSYDNIQFPRSPSSVPRPVAETSLTSLANAARSVFSAVASVANPVSSPVPVGRQVSDAFGGMTVCTRRVSGPPGSSASAPAGSRMPGSPRGNSPAGRQMSRSTFNNADFSSGQHSPFWSASSTQVGPQLSHVSSASAATRHQDGPLLSHVSSASFTNGHQGEASTGQFSPFWSGGQAPSSPRLSLGRQTSRASVTHAPPVMPLGSPRGASPDGRESSFARLAAENSGTMGCWQSPGSMPPVSPRNCLSAGGLPTRPSEGKIAGHSEMPGRHFTPYFQGPAAVSFSSFASSAAAPGSPRHVANVRQPPNGHTGAAPGIGTGGGADFSPFWSGGATAGPQSPGSTMRETTAAAVPGSASSTSAQRGYMDMNPPPGLLGELLGAGLGLVPQPKQPARPKTVFWRPPPEAAGACDITKASVLHRV